MGAVFLDMIVRSAEGAFIQVTVFVGAVLLLFGYIDYKQQGAFVNAVSNAKKYQPLIGSLLGILPGCGGSILVMPLYVKGTVTFGTVVATLIATSGDSAFVTLTQAPRDFAILTPICLVVGTVVGYICDYYEMGEWVKQRSTKVHFNNLAIAHREAEALLDELYCDAPGQCRSRDLKHIGHEEGDEIDMLLHHQTPEALGGLGYRLTHHCYLLFWALVAVGTVLGVMDLMQVDMSAFFFWPNVIAIIGTLGTLVTVLYMVCAKRFLQATSHEDTEHKLFSLKETLIHNAQETAFVGTWVFVSYLVYEVVVHLVGGEQVMMGAMVQTGFAAVILGILIGIIPGCGPQVVFVSLYLKGMFPFSALLANAVSQDGDALFPLIAMDRKSAFWATVVNTIAAFIVGAIAYMLEIRLS